MTDLSIFLIVVAFSAPWCVFACHVVAAWWEHRAKRRLMDDYISVPFTKEKKVRVMCRHVGELKPGVWHE